MIMALQAAMAGFNTAPEAEVGEALKDICASRRWVARVAKGRPYSSPDALYAAADEALAELSEADVDEAMAAHPRIGERSDHTASRREQSGVRSETVAALMDANREYEQRFGHVYLVCANGRSGEELLAVLRSRLDNDPATERRIARAELGKINRIRLARLIGDAE